jgi:hypothetical protein
MLSSSRSARSGFEVHTLVLAFAVTVRLRGGQLDAQNRANAWGRLREVVTAGIVRQMYGDLLGRMAVLLGFACFFATQVR